MLRWIRSKISSLWENKGEDGDDNEGTFRRSELDVSVLYAHGMDVGRLEDEIADIEEQAQEIEDARRRN